MIERGSNRERGNKRNEREKNKGIMEKGREREREL